MQIINSTPADIETIFTLYDAAIAYQKKHFHLHWLTFSREKVLNEIAQKTHWKMVVDGVIGCIFSVTYNDADIWFEKDKEPSLYIHRIAVNPQSRGAGFVPNIITWAKQYAILTGKKYVRIDAFNDNTKLIDYYVRCGFTYVGAVAPLITETSPPHYVGIKLGLMEIEVGE